MKSKQRGTVYLDVVKMTLSSFFSIQNLNQFLKYLTNKQRMTAVYKICSLKKKQKYI